MNGISQALKADAALIDRYLENIFANADSQYQTLFDSMRYSLENGGKRIRPILTLEFSRMLGGSDEAALPLAAAVEMVHTYSLIHDDLPCMDNDDIRRGKPTNHKVFGEATATLAGDGLLTHAFYVITENNRISSQAALRAVKTLSQCAGIFGMVGGQQMDMDGEKEKPTIEAHTKMNLKKTGELIKCACLMGCIAANADEKAFDAAAAYAERIGLAFQITDDLLDMGEEEQKTTYLSFYTPDAAKSVARALTDAAIEVLRDYPGSELLTSLAEYLYGRTV